MIDYEQLNQDYKNDNIYALQLEIGDKCNQGCIYCYMNAVEEEKNTLSDEQIKQILLDAKKLGISAIEWLGGEPLLRKSIFSHMLLAQGLGFRNNIWTGGLPLSDNFILKNTAKFADPGLISIHVSTINPEIYEKLHPNRDRKDLKNIISSIEKLIEIGYPPENILNSVTFTGLQTAEDMIQTIDYFQTRFGIKTSLNVYHTYLRPEISNEKLKRFIPSEKDVQKVYKHYAKQYNVRNLPMNCVNKQYCSATAAVLCDGSVTPCATIREKNAPNIHNTESLYEIILKSKDYLIIKKLKYKNNLSDDCKNCFLSDACWGCRSRSFAAGNGLYGKDPRCFRKKEVDKKCLNWQL
jgi:radical SAM protein with 4Fe4S-binding SPASM domain